MHIEEFYNTDYNEYMKNKLKNSKHSRGQLRYKLFFSYTIPMILIFGFMVIYYARVLINQSRENMEMYRISLDQQIIQSVNSNMLLLDKQSMLLNANTQDLADLFETPISSKFYYARGNISNLLTTQLQLNDNLDGVALLTLDGIPYLSWSRYGDSLNNYNSLADEWFQQTLELKGLPLIRVNHSNLFYYDTTQSLVSISRVLYSNSRQPLGIVVVYQPLQYIVDLLNPESLMEEEILLLIDQAGQIIWSGGAAENLDFHDNYADAESGTVVVSLNGTSVFRSISPPTGLGWRIISYLPLDRHFELTDLLLNINVLLLLVLILLSFTLSAIMAFIVTKPLKQLTLSFKQVGQGNLDALVDIKGTDEISVIGTAYNDMLMQTKNFINERYEMNLLVTRAELEALQSQINPHFLFNTLNSIKAVIDSKDSPKAIQMVQVLADLLRYNLSKGQYQVCFAEDLDVTKKYLYLQQCRFGGNYLVDYDIDDAVLSLSILKLTLQPLVENAIQHGLESFSRSGELHIVAKRLGEMFIIYIANTGNIIDEEDMKQINDRLAKPLSDSPLSQEQLGIFNVNRRIRLHYGEQYGLQMSRSEDYTTVRITLPARLNEAPILERVGGKTNEYSDY